MPKIPIQKSVSQVTKPVPNRNEPQGGRTVIAEMKQAHKIIKQQIVKIDQINAYYGL